VTIVVKDDVTCVCLGFVMKRSFIGSYVDLQSIWHYCSVNIFNLSFMNLPKIHHFCALNVILLTVSHVLSVAPCSFQENTFLILGTIYGNILLEMLLAVTELVH
jgi:hypothetical protein